MKKLLFLSFIFLFSPICQAQTGYVDYNVIYKNIEISNIYQKRIQEKEQLAKKIISDTQKNIIDKNDTERKEFLKAQKEQLKKLEEEFIELKYQQDKTVKEKVKEAADIVLKEKGLDIIIDSEFRVTGGVDCTQDILKAIK